VHFFKFREANGFACEPFNPCSQREVLPLDFLCLRLANDMLVRWQMTRVGTPVVGIKAGDSEWLQECLELQEDDIASIAENIGQDNTGLMIDGMPKPAWVFFALDKTPHFVDLGFFGINFLNDNSCFRWV
jgi:hypothetical protein